MSGSVLLFAIGMSYARSSMPFRVPAILWVYQPFDYGVNLWSHDPWDHRLTAKDFITAAKPSYPPEYSLLQHCPAARNASLCAVSVKLCVRRRLTVKANWSSHMHTVQSASSRHKICSVPNVFSEAIVIRNRIWSVWFYTQQTPNPLSLEGVCNINYHVVKQSKRRP